MEQIVSVARAPRQTRDQLIHRLDGRYGVLLPGEIQGMATALAERLDTGTVDLVIGIPEGGIIPAFAVAQVARLPLALATRTMIDLPRRVSFLEPHVLDCPEFHIYGLDPGTRAVIVEDEVTTGRTIVNAVRALRAGGVVIDAVSTLIVVDHPTTWRRLRDEGIALDACIRVSGEFLERIGADGA